MKFGKYTIKKQLALLFSFVAVTLPACSYYEQDYGVFLSYEGDLDRLAEYDTVVIDAQYFKATDIAEFRSEGHKVYSYINVGSL